MPMKVYGVASDGSRAPTPSWGSRANLKEAEHSGRWLIKQRRSRTFPCLQVYVDRHIRSVSADPQTSRSQMATHQHVNSEVVFAHEIP